MANVSYEEYQKQQAARQAANGGNQKPVHFMNEWLAKDGDFVVVRFPYTSQADIQFESVHNVVGVFPGDKFGKSVRCTGTDDCPLCNSKDEAVQKRKLKFYAKFVVYNPTSTGAELCATVWERPSGFADIDLKNLMTEYGDLSNYLFKIVRTGKGTDTRYNIIPVNMQSPVYSQPAYSQKDFSCLEGIDATKILSKSIEQYNQALNPTTEATEQKTVEEFKVPESKAIDDALGLPSQQNQTVVTSQPTAQTEVQNQTISQPTSTSGPTRYKF